jgi:hypothetical protein
MYPPINARTPEKESSSPFIQPLTTLMQQTKPQIKPQKAEIKSQNEKTNDPPTPINQMSQLYNKVVKHPHT